MTFSFKNGIGEGICRSLSRDRDWQSRSVTSVDDIRKRAVSSAQQKNEVLLPGSMTAAFRGVAWRGRGWFHRHFLSTLFKMSLCAAKLDEGERGRKGEAISPENGKGGGDT